MPRRRTRIDPRTGAIVKHVDVAAKPADGDIAAGSVWIPHVGSSKVTRIDATTGVVAGTIETELKGLFVIGAIDDAVWAADFGGTDVVRIDPTKT